MRDDREPEGGVPAHPLRQVTAVQLGGPRLGEDVLERIVLDGLNAHLAVGGGLAVDRYQVASVVSVGGDQPQPGRALGVLILGVGLARHGGDAVLDVRELGATTHDRRIGAIAVQAGRRKPKLRAPLYLDRRGLTDQPLRLEILEKRALVNRSFEMLDQIV